MLERNKREIAIWIGFKSRINATNARIPSLLADSASTRCILISGVKKIKLDRTLLFLLRIYKKTLFPIIHHNYEWVHVMGTNEIPGVQFNQILHLDDPTFSNTERIQIASWNNRLNKASRKGLVVVTSRRIETYVKSINAEILTCIVEQGFTAIEDKPEKYAKFSFVYSSPYIDHKGDKNDSHPSWSAIHLLEDIIPYISKNYRDAEIHLIGRLGKGARSYLSQFEGIVCHGLVNPKQNAHLLSRCHIALYPRTQDMQRRVLKVAEYMGAEIPVVAYRLEDTKLVLEHGTGLLADNYSEFLANLDLLYSNESLRQKIVARIKIAKKGRSWKELGIKLDQEIELHSRIAQS